MLHHVSCVFSQKKDPERVQIGFFVVRGSTTTWPNLARFNTSRHTVCWAGVLNQTLFPRWFGPHHLIDLSTGATPKNGWPKPKPNYSCRLGGGGHGYTTQCLLWTWYKSIKILCYKMPNGVDRKNWLLLNYKTIDIESYCTMIVPEAFSSTKTKAICPFSGLSKSTHFLMESLWDMPKVLTKRSPNCEKTLQEKKIRAGCHRS